MRVSVTKSACKLTTEVVWVGSMLLLGSASHSFKHDPRELNWSF